MVVGGCVVGVGADKHKVSQSSGGLLTAPAAPTLAVQLGAGGAGRRHSCRSRCCFS